MNQIPHLGETCALAAALCWSVAVILFRTAGLSVPPVLLNVVKNLLVVTLFAATFLLLGGDSPPGVSTSDYALLLASGAIGMALSDTFFFMCLNRLGAGLQAIVNTAYSPSIIFLSILFLGERLGPWQWLGVAMILGAVLSVVWMKGPRGERSTRTVVIGTIFGVLGSLTQGVSVVMIKPFLDELIDGTTGNLELGLTALVWATCVRMVGGTAASMLLLPLTPNLRLAILRLKEWRVLRVMIPAALMGSYLSLILWMAGFMWADASVASTLNQTATLFTFLLAALLLREPVTLLRISGLMVGVGGVVLVTLCG